MKKIKKEAREKRKSERLNVSLHIKYELLPGKKILEEVLTQNISGGGFGVKVAKPLKKGTKLNVLLYFQSDPNPISAASEVAWCRKELDKTKDRYAVGIKHIKVVLKDKERFIFLFCETMINTLAENC